MGKKYTTDSINIGDHSLDAAMMVSLNTVVANHSNYLTTMPAHNQAWSTITSTPTTLAGYGITDAALASHGHNYLPLTGGTLSGNLDVNADIKGNTFTQEATGIPRNNLGSPTVSEMALFDNQFTPKTTLANSYDDLTDLTFWVQTTSSSAWTEVTTYSDDQKRRFLRTNNSSVIIPNGAYKFRVEFVGRGYTFANAMYAYWSSNSHNTQVHIWKYNVNSSSWLQHTSSSTTVSSWPGHLYLPFSTIPWLETATTHTGHFKSIRIEFTPNWSTGTYSDRNINLSGIQLWGGYPSGKRTVHSYDQNGKLNLYDDLNVPGDITVGGTVDGVDISALPTSFAPTDAEANVYSTAAELLTAIKTVDGSGSGLDADTVDGTDGGILKRINGEVIKDVVDDYSARAGTWFEGTNESWGPPNITGKYAYTDGGGSSITFDVPSGMESCWISQLTWSSGGYLDVLGVQSDGDEVFLRRINTHQAVQNSNEGNGSQHDGSTVAFAGTSLSSFGKIKFQNRAGRFHMTGIAFSSSQWEGTEGTGMIHPAQITKQGSGNGLDSDKLDGQEGTYYLDYNNFTNTPTIPQGDITSVAAGTGMTGGGTTGAVTLNVIGGTGITANANDIAIDATVVTLTGSQALTNKTGSNSQWTNDAGYTTNTGTTTPDSTETFTNKSGSNSQWTNDEGYTTNTGDITSVTAGIGLTGGGTSGAVTLNVAGNTYTPFNDIRSLGVPAFTGGANPNITTAQVMAEIEYDGGFDSHSSVFKTSWNYAGNYNLTDAGDFTETAGSSWITWTDNSSDSTRGNITTLAIAPNTGGSAGGVFIYNDQGSSYAPGWRQVWTSMTDGAGSGLDADKLDGQEGTYYLDYNNFTNTPTIPQGDITAVTAGTGLTGGGTSGAVTLNAIGGDGITANANDLAVDSTVARKYVGTATGIDNTAYKTAFTVNGGTLSSHIRFTVQGTTGSVVVSNLIDLAVNHHQDIQIKALSGNYTLLSVKVISNDNEDFEVQLKTNSANPATLHLEVFPLGSEIVTFTSTSSFTGATGIFDNIPYGNYMSGRGGDEGDLFIGGNLTVENGDVTVENGNVGVGTANPTADLHVQGLSAADVPIIRSGGFGNSGSKLELAETLTNGDMNYGFSFFNDGNSSNTLIIKAHNNSTTGTAAITIGRTNALTTFSTVPIVGTRTAGDNSTYAASTAFVTSAVAGVPIGNYLPLAGGTMTGNIAMGNNNITGLSQLAFTDNLRFDDLGADNYLRLTYGDAGAGGLQIYDGDNTLQGYLYADGGGTSSFGLLSGAGQWGVKVVEGANTSLYYGGTQKLFTTTTGIDVTGTAQMDTGITEGIHYVGTGLEHWGDGGTGMSFPANDILSLRTASSDRLYINATGNVGIGTTTPHDKLHVNGTVRSTAPTTSDWGFLGYNSAGAAASGLWFENGDGQILLRDDQNNLNVRINSDTNSYINGGNLGLGTTGPAQKLTINSGRMLVTNNTTPIYIKVNSGYKSWVHHISSDDGYIFAPSTLDGGEVWDWANQTKLGANGVVRAKNFELSSDERFKDNVKDIKDNEIKVAFKSFEIKSSPGEKRYGVIAQELEKNNPELVTTDTEGFKSVKYIDLLIAKIAELEARLEKLEK